jgi:thioredoxin-like negative regulator of GroEL
MIRVLYFGKDDCAPCAEKKPMVVRTCKAHGVPCQLVDATTAHDLVAQYQVRSVPTAVVVAGDTGKRIAGFAGGLLDEGRLVRLFALYQGQ